ncbi:MAG TPA: alpha/beta fold hydrolase [Gemmatimonadales bacterium]|jgi:pimeloyl-ACP methyl ester carboxylesterase
MRHFRLFASALVYATIMATSARPAWGQGPVSGRTLHVNDIEMYVEVRGKGDPLVLLHGFGSCGQVWAPFVDRFAGHYQVIIPDLRGHGRSTNPSGTFTHRQAALDVFALLDQLGVKHFKAMGMSAGGMVLLHMATQQRERMDAMVLISSTPYFPENTRAIMREAAAEKVDPPDACATRGASQMRELAGQFVRFKDSYDDMNFTPPYLGTIKARTLIVHGDRDPFFDVSIPVGMYDAIPGAALWIVPEGRHIPIFKTHLREFEDVALEFLGTQADKQ